MVDYRKLFDDFFEKAKRNLRRDGKLKPVIYILHPNSEQFNVFPYRTDSPEAKNRSAYAACVTASLVNSPGVILVTDTWVRWLDRDKHAEEAIRRCNEKGISDDPQRRECVSAMFYGPSATFIRFQEYKRVGRTIVFEEVRETDEGKGQRAELYRFFPWWEPQQREAHRA
jgi:hypothetical protein